MNTFASKLGLALVGSLFLFLYVVVATQVGEPLRGSVSQCANDAEQLREEVFGFNLGQ